jgi:hypothetical protein
MVASQAERPSTAWRSAICEHRLARLSPCSTTCTTTFAVPLLSIRRWAKSESLSSETRQPGTSRRTWNRYHARPQKPTHKQTRTRRKSWRDCHPIPLSPRPCDSTSCLSLQPTKSSSVTAPAEATSVCSIVIPWPNTDDSDQFTGIVVDNPIPTSASRWKFNRQRLRWTGLLVAGEFSPMRYHDLLWPPAYVMIVSVVDLSPPQIVDICCLRSSSRTNERRCQQTRTASACRGSQEARIHPRILSAFLNREALNSANASVIDATWISPLVRAHKPSFRAAVIEL